MLLDVGLDNVSIKTCSCGGLKEGLLRIRVMVGYLFLHSVRCSLHLAHRVIVWVNSFALEVSDHLVWNLAKYFFSQANRIVVVAVELHKLDDISAGILFQPRGVQRSLVCIQSSHHAEVSGPNTDDDDGNWVVSELNNGVFCGFWVCNSSICKNQTNVIFLVILIFGKASLSQIVFHLSEQRRKIGRPKQSGFGYTIFVCGDYAFYSNNFWMEDVSIQGKAW